MKSHQCNLLYFITCFYSLKKYFLAYDHSPWSNLGTDKVNKLCCDTEDNYFTLSSLSIASFTDLSDVTVSSFAHSISIYYCLLLVSYPTFNIFPLIFQWSMKNGRNQI